MFTRNTPYRSVNPFGKKKVPQTAPPTNSTGDVLQDVVNATMDAVMDEVVNATTEN